MRSRLGAENRPLWHLASSPSPYNKAKGGAVLWELCPWVAWAQGESRQSHGSEKFCRKNHHAHQKHIWIQHSTWSPGQWGHGPHGSHDHQHPQSTDLNWMPPTLPHEPSRDGKEAARCTRAGGETRSKGARRKFSVSQQWLSVPHHPHSPLCRDDRCNLLSWHSAARQHPLHGLHQGRHNICSP